MRHSISVYCALIRASIRSQLRYKVSMAFNVFGYFVVFWSESATIWILFTHFGTLAAALVLLGEPIPAVGALALLWALVGGAALFSGVYVLQGAVGMKTLQNIEAFNILTNGGPEMAQFPMSIYPRPVRLLFTFLVPLAGVVYYPTVTFLRKSAEAPVWLGWVGPTGGLLFLAGALMVFRAVERSYISTGS